MLAISRSKILTVSVTAKHTADEETRIRETADRAGLTVSEWARQTHLAAISVSPETRMILAELAAFRQLSGWFQLQHLQKKAFDASAIKEEVAKVDSLKFSWADERIEKYFAMVASQTDDEESEDSEEAEPEPEKDEPA